MKSIFAKLPRPMQRTFADDLKWAAAFLVGAVIGYFAFGHGDTGLLIGSLIGVTITIVSLNVARRVSRRFRR
jgi:F0F1-type ATP synthase assembly protein I